jgi:acetyl-CoA acetyltransferase
MDRPSSDSTIVVLRGARTPFGDFGGSLRDVSAVELGVHAARGALERSGISPALGAAPLGRIVSWGVAGVDPDIMGIGPVPASRQALHRAGLGIQELDLVEINEAFAAQYLAVERELGPWWPEALHD